MYVYYQNSVGVSRHAALDRCVTHLEKAEKVLRDNIIVIDYDTYVYD